MKIRVTKKLREAVKKEYCCMMLDLEAELIRQHEELRTAGHKVLNKICWELEKMELSGLKAIEINY